MINDTTTLNGALTELGETMAGNLNDMGVSSADPSDGLTTLAGKILDIEPSINGLELNTNIDIDASSNEIFNGQTVLFTALLSASYDDESVVNVDLSGVLTGATVQFRIGNTVIGTGVTDNNGVATYSHTFDSMGSYDVVAVFAGTENFDEVSSSSVTVTVGYSFNIVSDKDILSSNDGDVATITATLVDGEGVVSGETVDYRLLDKDGTLLDSGSDDTDSNGEISVSYTATGVGDVTVEFMLRSSLLQKTYEIEDCWNTQLSEITIGGGQTVSSIGMDTVHNVQNEDFILIFDHKGNGNLNIGAKSQYNPPSTANYRLTLGTYANKHYFSVRTSSADEASGTTANDNTYYTYKIEKQGTTVKFYVDDTLLATKTVNFFADYSEYSIYNIKWGDGTDYMKNIRLKAL